MSGAKMGWSRIFTVGQKNSRVGSGAHLFYCLKIKEPFIVQFTLDGYWTWYVYCEDFNTILFLTYHANTFLN